MPKKKKRVKPRGSGRAEGQAARAERASPPPPATHAAPRAHAGWIVAVIAAIGAIVLLVRERTAHPEPEHERPARAERPDRSDAPSEDSGSGDRPERLRLRVLRAYPHDIEAFTQGLLWHGGHLLESTGLYGDSSLREVELDTGRVLRRRAITGHVFGEGLALVGDRLVMLTWMEHEARVFRLDDFEPVRTFDYEGEGWGLTYDGRHLVMSDGSAILEWRDPETFRVVRSVEVTERGEPLDQLNELEWVDGVIWSNVWQTDRIVRIDPETGRVTGVVDARGLLEDSEAADADVLNGIAWIPERRHFIIGGKLWPRIFEVEIVPAG